MYSKSIVNYLLLYSIFMYSKNLIRYEVLLMNSDGHVYNLNEKLNCKYDWMTIVSIEKVFGIEFQSTFIKAHDTLAHIHTKINC